MMEKRLTLTALSLVTLMSSSAAFAEEIDIYGGKVHFVGQVITASCAVSPDSSDQTVMMGQTRSAELADKGSKGQDRAFHITLEDCDTSTMKNASVAFRGRTVVDLPSVLDLTGDSKNVGLEIKDWNGKTLALDGVDYSTPSHIVEGTNRLDFAAHYYSLGAAEAGTANGDVIFTMQYL